MRNVVK